MPEYRNIDDVVNDAEDPMMLIKDNELPDFPEIPKISEQVTLATDAGYSMLVEITDIANGSGFFKGKVIQGYFPQNDYDSINIGEIVEFSQKKIESIHKK